MRKSTIIVKRLLALFLVVLMSIESFGALVSDNDGSAFITKGEFDSLKSSFQSQIDNYNTSIDSKIDGAISAYLAGVNLTKKSPISLQGEISTNLGNGYRQYDGAFLSRRVEDLSEWIISMITAAPRAGRWEDLNAGYVGVAYKTAEAALSHNASQLDNWENGYFDPTVPGYGSSSKGAADWMAAIIVTRSNGTLAPTEGYDKPIIFTNKYGVITSFDNSRITFVDSRFFKSLSYPSSYRRGIVLVGNQPSVSPGSYLFNFNANLNITGNGGTVTSGRIDTANFGSGDGLVRALVRSSTQKFNNNVFCFNFAENDLVDAFLNDKEKLYVNSKIVNTPLTLDEINFSSSAILGTRFFVQNPNGTSDNHNMFFISRPEVHFETLANNTSLPSSCFATDTNDDYKRLKLQYLVNGDFTFNYNGTTYNPYVYQGIPIYTTKKDGELEFEIKVDTNYSGTYYFQDPGNTSSKICLRIKEGAFGWGNDTTNNVKMKVDSSNTEVEEAKINRGQVTKIRINCEENKTYFLRWYVDGYQYGGEITYIGNGYFTETS